MEIYSFSSYVIVFDSTLVFFGKSASTRFIFQTYNISTYVWYQDSQKDSKSSFLFTLVRLVQNELGSVKEMPHLLSPFTQKTNFTSSLGYELLRLLTSFLEAPVIFFYYNKNYTSFWSQKFLKNTILFLDHDKIW